MSRGPPEGDGGPEAGPGRASCRLQQYISISSVVAVIIDMLSSSSSSNNSST